MRLPLQESRAPALAIAAYVTERGAVYSGEILDRFLMSQSTLRRRRPELRRLGIVFVERGRGSLYVAPELADHLPTNQLPQHAVFGGSIQSLDQLLEPLEVRESAREGNGPAIRAVRRRTPRLERPATNVHRLRSNRHARNRPGTHAVGLLTVVAVVAVVAGAVLVLRSLETSAEPNTAPTRSEGASSGASYVRLPTASALRRARLFATKRLGLVSFAFVDTSGALSCYRCRVKYHSASVVKVMLLVSYLNRLANENDAIPADHEAYLNSMIRASDNAATTAIYAHVSDEGLYQLAEKAQMTDFHVSGGWGSARITAADQARFFANLDDVAAPEFRTYVRELLSSIIPEQSWGIPEVSRPEWSTFFKGGWLTTRRGNLVHQVARLERGTSSMAIAILTDGDPSDSYGRETIRGLAKRLLRP